MPPGAYFFLAEGFTGILIVSGTPVSGLTFGHDLNLTLSDPSSCTALPKPLHELQCHTNSGVRSDIWTRPQPKLVKSQRLHGTVQTLARDLKS